MENKKCKICRRLGTKLFLKGDRCLSPKCSVVKRPYAPGMKGKRRSRGLSEYGKELSEKQKLRNWYNLRERQFSNYVMEILNKKEQSEGAGEQLIKKLEGRLDNVIFRLGFAPSRGLSRQLVNHGHFLINGKSVDVPSYQVKKEDVITVKPSAKKLKYFQEIVPVLKKTQAPSWIQFDAGKMEAKITGESSLEEAAPPAEISSIFEFYSK